MCNHNLIAGSKLKAEEITGFNPLAKSNTVIDGKEEVKMSQENIGGLDKLYPCGPKCVVNGKEIPMFVACTKKGSVTSKLLAQMLQAIDKSGAYDNDEELVLLLYGHGSRFQKPFLKYILEEKPRWKVINGVPYGTHI